MAAFAILPAAIALGGEDAAMAGPSLLFVTLQDVFAAMGSLGPVFGLIFYILVFIAAITSAISLVEVVTTFYMDKAHAKGQPGNRKKYTILTCLAILVLAVIVAADGLGSNGLWQPLGYCWLDFMDLWSEGIMMPLGALFMCIFIGYEYKVDTLAEEIEQNGNVFKTKKVYAVCCKIVVPLAMFLVLFGQLQTFGIIK
jgi:NSS family neurotransmitter:Na+ symporter